MASDAVEKNSERRSREWGLRKSALQMMGTAIVTFAVYSFVCYRYKEWFSKPLDDSITSFWAFAFQWMLLPALFLLGTIFVTAQTRVWTSAVDGSNRDAQKPLEVLARIIQNSLEQTVCLFIGVLALSSCAPAAPVSYFIPSYTILFLIGRVLFAVGYFHADRLRMLGFGLTFFSNVAVCSTSAYYFLNPLYDVTAKRLAGRGS